MLPRLVPEISPLYAFCDVVIVVVVVVGVGVVGIGDSRSWMVKTNEIFDQIFDQNKYLIKTNEIFDQIFDIYIAMQIENATISVLFFGTLLRYTEKIFRCFEYLIEYLRSVCNVICDLSGGDDSSSHRSADDSADFQYIARIANTVSKRRRFLSYKVIADTKMVMSCNSQVSSLLVMWWLDDMKYHV